MTDIDGWCTWDMIVLLFFDDNTDLHNRLILPYLTGSFHPSFIEEYDGLLMTLQIHNEESKLFTSTCDNFIQTGGIRDGDSHLCEDPRVFG